jgi:hypothetical protein
MIILPKDMRMQAMKPSQDIIFGKSALDDTHERSKYPGNPALTGYSVHSGSTLTFYVTSKNSPVYSPFLKH